MILEVRRDFFCSGTKKMWQNRDEGYKAEKTWFLNGSIKARIESISVNVYCLQLV